MMKKILLIVVCALGLMTAKVNAQLTTVLSIDFAAQVDSMEIGGITNFQVRVRVTGNPDSLTGDIFYYYLTDSMQSVFAPPRVFLQDTVNELVTDLFLDTIPIDIQPNEIRTGPMNYIIIWPAMNVAVADTDSIVIQANCIGFIGLEPPITETKSNILFPCPALQYLYLRQEEIELISHIKMIGMKGETVDDIYPNRFSNGWVNIDQLKTGNYTALISYKNGSTVSMRFIKQ